MVGFFVGGRVGALVGARVVPAFGPLMTQVSVNPDDASKDSTATYTLERMDAGAVVQASVVPALAE